MDHSTTSLPINRPAQYSHWKRLGMLLLVAIALILVSNCSVLVATPQATRVQVTGINNQVNEYVIISSEPYESDLGIRISDRYAIGLDFQWLWSEPKRLDENMTDAYDENSPSSPTPWFTCRYRF